MEKKEYLPNHSSFTTALKSKVGWKLRVSFADLTEHGDIEPVQDPYISPVEMTLTHESIDELIAFNGVPLVGDCINLKSESPLGHITRVLERTFDMYHKEINIYIERL